MPKGIKLNNSGYSKCTKEEKEVRIEEAAEWLLQNPDSKWTDFVEWAKAKWNIQRDMANRYMKMANERLGNVETNVEAARKIAELSLKNLLRLAIQDEDAKLALQIRMEINKISGLYTTRVQIEDSTEKPIFNTTPIVTDKKDNE